MSTAAECVGARSAWRCNDRRRTIVGLVAARGLVSARLCLSPSSYFSGLRFKLELHVCGFAEVNERDYLMSDFLASARRLRRSRMAFEGAV